MNGFSDADREDLTYFADLCSDAKDGLKELLKAEDPDHVYKAAKAVFDILQELDAQRFGVDAILRKHQG